MTGRAHGPDQDRRNPAVFFVEYGRSVYTTSVDWESRMAESREGCVPNRQ